MIKYVELNLDKNGIPVVDLNDTKRFEYKGAIMEVHGDTYSINVPFPGKSKEQIGVEYVNGILYCRDDEGNKSYEFGVGRRFEGEITAKMENGMLTVTLPKKSSKIEVEFSVDIK